jgi:alpha-galactosidase
MATITLIGAGSVEFTRGLISDVVTSPELHGTTIALHDIDAERLSVAETLARRANEQTGAGLTITASPDRRAALEGADYVVNEIQVGGYAATLLDFEIPAKYGLRQTIGDTIGIGGIFRGLRTIPVMVDIGRDLADVCPDALLLNYTNPMAMIPWAVAAGSPFTNVVGVCHSVRDTHAFLARTVGVPEDDIEYLTSGFNHQAFVIRFERRSTGENLYPRLDEAIAADPDGLGRRVRVELYRQIGYFPTESSEHSAEYVPWFMGRDDQIERYRIPVDEYLRRSEENLAEYEAMEQAVVSGAELEIEPTHELASNIIHAIETGSPREEYVNVPNGGLVANLPPDRGRGSAASLRGAQPYVLERRRAHGHRCSRGRPAARVPSGDARPERRRQPVTRRHPLDVRRAHRGTRRTHAGGHPGLARIAAGRRRRGGRDQNWISVGGMR